MTPCACGQAPVTRIPHPLCAACARAYYQPLVRTGAGLAELGRLMGWPPDPVPVRLLDFDGRLRELGRAIFPLVRTESVWRQTHARRLDQQRRRKSTQRFRQQRNMRLVKGAS